MTKSSGDVFYNALEKWGIRIKPSEKILKHHQEGELTGLEPRSPARTEQWQALHASVRNIHVCDGLQQNFQ